MNPQPWKTVTHQKPKRALSRQASFQELQKEKKKEEIEPKKIIQNTPVKRKFAVPAIEPKVLPAVNRPETKGSFQLLMKDFPPLFSSKSTVHQETKEPEKILSGGGVEVIKTKESSSPLDRQYDRFVGKIAQLEEFLKTESREHIRKLAIIHTAGGTYEKIRDVEGSSLSTEELLGLKKDLQILKEKCGEYSVKLDIFND